MRLFELLKKEQFKANGDGYFKRSFEYEELRGLLGIAKKEYPLFADIRRYVVESSVREINENPDIHITQVDYPKTGRKVSHIVFHCEKPRQMRLDVDEPLPHLEEVKEGEKKHPEYISELIAIGIDQQTAYRWKRKYSVARLREAIAYTKAMKKAGKIRDSLTGFLAKAVTDNIGASWAQEQKKSQSEKAKLDAETNLKKAKEANQIEAERAERDAIAQRFQSLPQEAQDRAREAYESSASGFALSAWERAKKKNPSTPEISPAVRVAFLLFFRDFEG